MSAPNNQQNNDSVKKDDDELNIEQLENELMNSRDFQPNSEFENFQIQEDEMGSPKSIKWESNLVLNSKNSNWSDFAQPIRKYRSIQLKDETAYADGYALIDFSSQISNLELYASSYNFGLFSFFGLSLVPFSLGILKIWSFVIKSDNEPVESSQSNRGPVESSQSNRGPVESSQSNVELAGPVFMEMHDFLRSFDRVSGGESNSVRLEGQQSNSVSVRLEGQQSNSVRLEEQQSNLVPDSNVVMSPQNQNQPPELSMEYILQNVDRNLPEYEESLFYFILQAIENEKYLEEILNSVSNFFQDYPKLEDDIEAIFVEYFPATPTSSQLSGGGSYEVSPNAQNRTFNRSVESSPAPSPSPSPSSRDE